MKYIYGSNGLLDSVAMDINQFEPFQYPASSIYPAKDTYNFPSIFTNIQINSYNSSAIFCGYYFSILSSGNGYVVLIKNDSLYLPISINFYKNRFNIGVGNSFIFIKNNENEMTMQCFETKLISNDILRSFRNMRYGLPEFDMARTYPFPYIENIDSIHYLPKDNETLIYTRHYFVYQK
jgi:hypothetical protein